MPLEFETLAVQGTSDSKMQLYPNPAKNEIFVDWKSTDAVYSILDAKGSLVAKKVTLAKGKNKIDISKLPSGLYFIEISVAGKSSTTKFIKE